MKNILIVCLLFPLLLFSQSNFEQARKLFEEGEFEQSQTIFQSLLKKTPSDLKVNEYLGDIAGRNKSWDTAIGYYQKLKQLKPSEANYYYKYGGALGMKALEVNKFKALGMISEVRESFEKAIVLNPRHIDSRWALIELYIKLPGIIGGSESKALKYSNELQKLSAVDGYMSKGHIAEYFRRFKTAEQQYEKAIAVSGSVKAREMLANLYKNKLNEPEKAKLILKELKKSKSID
jgi:tetratricopeptide (TPR) repeat protein